MIVMAVLEKPCYYKVVSNDYICMIVMAVLEKPCYYMICVLICLLCVVRYLTFTYLGSL